MISRYNFLKLFVKIFLEGDLKPQQLPIHYPASDYIWNLNNENSF